MKITVSPTLIACLSMLASVAHGSLLSKLLGNIQLQLSVCPEIVLNTGGSSHGANGKAATQSSNPACPNYVPPSAQQQQPAVEVEEEESSVVASLAEQSIAAYNEPTVAASSAFPSPTVAASSAFPSPTVAASSAFPSPTTKGTGKLVDIPQQPAAQSSAPSAVYSTVAVDKFPRPTQETASQVLAQKTQRQPALPTPTAQEKVKCVWVTHTIDLGNIPAQALGQQPLWNEWPAPTVPPAAIQPAAEAVPVTSWLQVNQGMAPAMGLPPGGANQIDEATTRTVLLPDGQQQVIVESRNAGFYEYAF
ncbi:hypothetical protein GGI23_001554 [Coemansia sp. RSA 2559]|nr:hypothetical protein GGI23_001554 [Coemansia sp. RSA 2559]KAJ2852835.1 hypothetical protein GGI22_005123 [Coemansia erecta]